MRRSPSLEKCGFAAMHIFPYSVRPGTKAAAMAQVDMSVREERARARRRRRGGMHQGYLARCVGKTFPVLFEQDRGEEASATRRTICPSR